MAQSGFEGIRGSRQVLRESEVQFWSDGVRVSNQGARIPGSEGIRGTSQGRHEGPVRV